MKRIKITALVLVVVMLFFCIYIPSFASFDNTHTNSGNQKEDLIAVAKTQIGYKEGSLEGRIQGSNDYTKYGLWYDRSFAYEPWCAMFVSWCAEQAGIPRSVIPKFASCDLGMDWFCDKGRFNYSANYGGSVEPKVGDIVFFGYRMNNGYFDSTHVGIVYAVDDNTIYSLEGNSSMKVQSVRYNKVGMNYGSYIIGYGRPKYTGSSIKCNTNDTRTVNATGVSMYSEPSTVYGTLLCKIPAGAHITITDYSTVWGLAEYSGNTGWVMLENCDSDFTTYKITFKANGGSGAPSSVIFAARENVALPKTKPTRNGYSFEGWAREKDAYTAEYYPGFDYTGSGDVTLYAVWQPLTPKIKYTVSEGGAVERIVYDETVTFRIVTKPGYVFYRMTLDGKAVNTKGCEAYKYYDVSSTEKHNLNFVFKSVRASGINPYKDVKKTAWYFEAVVTDYYAGLMKGMSKNYFSPATELTRAQLVTVMANMFVHDGGEITTTAKVPFTDVNKKGYYYKYLCWAYDYGIVSGVSKKSFAPDRAITREEFTLMVYNYYKVITQDPTETNGSVASLYADYNSVSSWAKKSVLWCLNNSIICGIDNNILPKSSLTRAQCAQILYNYYK